MVNQRQAIDQLDTLIEWARTGWYRPIQIAEILHRDRVHGPLDLRDLESYKNPSRAWRNEITKRFGSNKSTSSHGYQHSLFVTQIPPLILEKLGTINRKDPGTVEKRIYDGFSETYGSVDNVYEYISKVKIKDFTLREYTKRFEVNGGLKNSMDKAYEIAVYALFDSLLKQIRPRITVTIPEESWEINNEFRDFSKLAMNVGRKGRQETHTASVYRVGVANAADCGIDMWTNFGPAIQVKHTIMGKTGIDEIVKQLAPAKVIIVCREAEFEELNRRSKGHPQVQGIVTRKKLSGWYRKAMRGKHRSELGARVLSTLKEQFEKEFPRTKDDDFRNFYETEREYHLKNSLPKRRVKKRSKRTVSVKPRAVQPSLFRGS